MNHNLFYLICSYNNVRVTGVFNIRGVTDRLEIRKNSFSQKVVTRQPEGVGAVMGFKISYEEWVSTCSWK